MKLTLLANSGAYAVDGWRAAKREILVLASGRPVHHASRRTMLRATAVRTCCSRVLASPIYRQCRRSKSCRAWAGTVKLLGGSRELGELDDERAGGGYAASVIP